MKLIKISAIWCPSCLIMEKIWNQIKEEYPDFEYISYDYDLDDEAESFNPGNILPVIILLKDDEEVIRFIGEKTKDQIIEGINKYEE